MSTVLDEVTPCAVGVALSPFGVIVVVLLLSAPSPAGGQCLPGRLGRRTRLP